MSTITVIAFITLLAIRLYTILPSKKQQSRTPQSAHVSIAVFLGSGGHTSEALTLISALDFRRYNCRIYIVSQGDKLSVQKAITFERSKEPSPQKENGYRILTIPRARRVHQTLLTTPFSASLSLIACIYHLSFLPLVKNQKFSDILILNGPGTCFVLCIAAYLNKFFGLQTPLIIYVESFTRVNSLSLSGKLIRPLADRFILQWPEPRSTQRRNRNTWLV